LPSLRENVSSQSLSLEPGSPDANHTDHRAGTAACQGKSLAFEFREMKILCRSVFTQRERQGERSVDTLLRSVNNMSLPARFGMVKKKLVHHGKRLSCQAYGLILELLPQIDRPHLHLMLRTIGY
jgi:hypothetical protein